MFKFLIILAILIRVFLMPITAHSDLFFINMFPNLFITDSVVDIQTYVEKNFGSRNYTYYSPMTYYIFVFFQVFYHPFSESFSSWMSQLYNLELRGFQGQAADFIKSTFNPHIYKDLFLAKTPYLLFDFASAFILFKLFKDKFIKKAAILLWLFNPVNLYATYIIGQFDIIPTFFILSGFYSLRKNLTLALLLLGIAAALKNFALIFIVPIAIIYGDSTLKRLKILAIGVAPYLLFFVPAFIHNYQQALYILLPKVYLHYRKPLEGWPLFSQTIKYIILSVSYLMILLLSHKIKIKNKWLFSVSLCLVAILLIYAIAPRVSFHYLLWVTPLIILTVKNIKLATFIILTQAISFASYKLLANHLQLGLFSPLNPSFFSSLPTINEMIDKYFPYRVISTLGFLIFFFTNLYLSIKILVVLLFQAKRKPFVKIL